EMPNGQPTNMYCLPRQVNAVYGRESGCNVNCKYASDKSNSPKIVQSKNRSSTLRMYGNWKRSETVNALLSGRVSRQTRMPVKLPNASFLRATHNAELYGQLTGAATM